MTAGEWYEDHNELVAFARHMVDEEGWDTKRLLEYLEKPWKWSDEHEAWLPSSADSEGK